MLMQHLDCLLQHNLYEKVLGEADLTETDRKYLEFGEQFEERFINQGKYEFRDINQTLDFALELLKILPEEELDKL